MHAHVECVYGGGSRQHSRNVNGICKISPSFFREAKDMAINVFVLVYVDIGSVF